MYAGNVRGHEVRRALDPCESPAESRGKGLAEQCFAEAGSPLDQDMPTREGGDEQCADQILHADHGVTETALQSCLELEQWVHARGSRSWANRFWSRNRSTRLPAQALSYSACRALRWESETRGSASNSSQRRGSRSGWAPAPSRRKKLSISRCAASFGGTTLAKYRALASTYAPSFTGCQERRAARSGRAPKIIASQRNTNHQSV